MSSLTRLVCWVGWGSSCKVDGVVCRGMRFFLQGDGVVCRGDPVWSPDASDTPMLRSPDASVTPDASGTPILRLCRCFGYADASVTSMLLSYAISPDSTAFDAGNRQRAMESGDFFEFGIRNSEFGIGMIWNCCRGFGVLHICGGCGGL